MEGKIYQSLLAVAKEIPEIAKKKVGDKYDAFVTEEIVKIIREKMLEHGVLVVPRGVDRQTEFMTVNNKPNARHYVFMNHVFIADDGSSIETTTFGEGSGFNEEGLAKAQTRSFGAALREVFMIVDDKKAKTNKSEAFNQYWAQVRELKLTDGKQVLADHQNDPVKALEFIGKRGPLEAARPHLQEVPKPEPTPAAAPEEKPAPTQTYPTANDLPSTDPRKVAESRIRQQMWNTIVNRETSKEMSVPFLTALIGCDPQQASVPQLEKASVAIEAALKSTAFLSWVAAGWYGSLATKGKVLGLCAAVIYAEGEEQMLKTTGQAPFNFNQKQIEKLCDNLESWLQKDSEVAA